ncbi:alpha/beta hydrolase [Cutibacterium equinum]|uniref:Alpha/beta hydrolase n=1 Tax=Cutibacterium equinum TaxID=3016342 RepID=A0ABY7R0F0_9ACTN|nr:alpha/beta hydrolase [Cutibacterium equinum]WCC80769.1 alpha/beta hydrolase [Cutibacterium equinum]
MADTTTSRHSWLRIASGLLGLILALPVLAWSVAAILPSRDALTFVSSVLVGSLAVPALGIVAIALVFAFLARGALRVVAVIASVMALILPATATASTTWVTDRAGGRINVLSAAAVSSMASHPDETVRYGSRPDETAQIYRPQRHNAPVLVDIHGGGWNTDATMPATLRWFSDHGWLVVRPSYVLAYKGHPTWDIAPKQVACAWAWSLAHVKEFGGDPSRVSIMGDSAGGGMAINLAYGAASGKMTSSCGPMRAPKSVLALYPTVDVAAVQSVTTLGAGNAATMYIGGAPEQFPDRYRAVNSSTWITPKAPPTMVIQGNRDTFVPPSSVRDFVAHSRQAGVDVTHVQLPMFNHAFDIQARNSLGFQVVTTVGLAFLNEH